MEDWEGGVRVAVVGVVGSTWEIISSDDPYPTSITGTINWTGWRLVIVPEEWFPIHIDTSYGKFGAHSHGLPTTWVTR